MRRELAAALMALGLLGCSSAKEMMLSVAATDEGAVLPLAAPPAPPASLEVAGGSRASRGEGLPSAERMVVRTGAIALRCDDTSAPFAALRRIAEGRGGYVSASGTSPVGEDLLERHATLRIPAKEFDAVFDEVRSLCPKLLSEGTASQDVTEEFVDLGARLRNLEATERELLQILIEVRQKAKKASDVLEVYESIKGVRAEIEQAKGRIQYLDRQVGMATLEVTLTPVVPERPVVEPEGWSAGKALRGALRDLVSGLQLLARFAIYLVVTVLPILVVVAVPLYAFVRLAVWAVRRRKRP